MNLVSRDRFKYAAKWALRHFGISLAVATAAALLVFVVWYPHPTAELLQVNHVYLILLVVDVVCGPLLTFVLASPTKSRREFVLDLSLVAVIQLAALLWGLHALEAARPVAYVFEQDRLVVVSRNELYTKGCQACQNFGHISQVGKYISTVTQDVPTSLDLSLQGVSPAMRQATWKPWEWKNPKFQAALKPLSQLSQASLQKLKSQEAIDLYPDLKYIPLVSSKNLDWIAIFDKDGNWLKSLPIDGF